MSSTTFLRKRLVVWQANVKDAPNRVYALLDHAKKHGVHVINFQDPPAAFPWIQTPGYKPYYRAEKDLAEADDPRNLPKDKAVKLFGVCFLVLDTIPTEDWSVNYHQGDNEKLAATLSLRTPDAGTIEIHNVYNRGTKMDIDQLVDESASSPEGNDLLLGDFNLHHAEELYCNHKAAGVRCMTRPGAGTFARSVRRDGNCFTIDLTFASERIRNRMISCKPIDVRGFEPDHSVIEIVLDIRPSQDTGTRVLWKLVPRKKFLKAVEKSLKALGLPPLATKKDVDDYLKKLVDAIAQCIKDLVPVAPRSTGVRCRKDDNKSLREARVREKDALDRFRKNPTAKWKRFWTRRRSETIKKEIQSRTTRWRYKVVSAASKPQGIYHLARMAKRVSAPRELPQMREMEDESGVIRDDQTKARRRPKALRKLKDGEISDIIRKLVTGKAAGPDGVGNEALRMINDIITPYLEHAFNACMSLSHHPLIFSHPTTIMLPKVGKPLNRPRSWRPIALLPCIGKIYEKVITNRLQDLAVEHNLLASTQYGLPGKSTTTALQYLLNPIYAAWGMAPKMKVSLLSIDIKGAYDRVVRIVVLEIMMDLGIPHWLVDIVAAFLSTRSTVLKLPGCTTRRFWINIGLWPEGDSSARG
ncbi:hypothetical protein FSARC_9464 [Fusarium sarcochroum]|uniref:Reverse transcriptase domain-containing protein n=1 Tax=Fusarium sarcochroum TaxID=1208366 RepID=A0A8H4TRB2_9HYPO|nr:hypothetical protein FSARC_9464 [Fusarium sarcochroum]